MSATSETAAIGNCSDSPRVAIVGPAVANNNEHKACGGLGYSEKAQSLEELKSGLYSTDQRTYEQHCPGPKVVRKRIVKQPCRQVTPWKSVSAHQSPEAQGRLPAAANASAQTAVCRGLLHAISSHSSPCRHQGGRQRTGSQLPHAGVHEASQLAPFATVRPNILAVSCSTCTMEASQSPSKTGAKHNRFNRPTKPKNSIIFADLSSSSMRRMAIV